MAMTVLGGSGWRSLVYQWLFHHTSVGGWVGVIGRSINFIYIRVSWEGQKEAKLA